MPSLPNTLRRCHSTVRGLRNSCAPISGFVLPSAARCAICSSCGRQVVERLDRALAHRLPRRQQLAPGALGEHLHADLGQHRVRGAELLAGVHAAVLAPQPLAVDQQRAALRDADAGAVDALDRLAVEPLGGFTLAQQRPRAGEEAERPVGAVGLGDLRQPLERAGRPLRLAAWAAASTRSASNHIGVPSPRGSSAPRSAATSASS